LDFVAAFRTHRTGNSQTSLMKTDRLQSIFKCGDEPVAILGSGMSGQAAQKLLSAKGRVSEFFDEKHRLFESLDAAKCSFVVVSPGFRPNHEWVKLALNVGKEVISEVDLGLVYSKHTELVSITGTNGKTSLASILDHVASRLNVPCTVLGNIGKPISAEVAEESLSGKIVFLETSSFQAITSNHLKPDSLLWTNFSQDHLDYHGTEKDYYLAKFRLVSNCKNMDEVFLGRSVLSQAKKFGLDTKPQWQIIDPLSADELPARISSFHKSVPQRENLAFALRWFKRKEFCEAQFFDALGDYRPYPHRLFKVNEINDISFWNDSKSTNLGSTLAACESFSKKVIWIGGGKNKGQEIKKFATALFPYLQGAFLIGETADELSKHLTERNIKTTICRNLKSAVAVAFEFAKKHTDILFSPGFASFDMFSNYSDRGNSFESLVFDLKSACQVSTKINVKSFAS